MNFQHLSPQYLAEIARQLAFLSAFLGGFAATFLATLVISAPKRSLSSWIISLTAFSASFFIVAVLVFIGLVIVLNPNAPKNVASPSSMMLSRVLGILSFLFGMLCLLSSIGLSGWLHSKRTGLATSLAALMGIFLALLVSVGVG